jgi:hypothetical protein
MRNSITFGAILLFALHSTIALAGADDPTSPIERGHKAYKNEGPREAIVAWTQGGPMEGNKEALSQANLLVQIQEYYGTYSGYTVVENVRISDTTRILYLTLDYQHGPVFSYFLVFRKADGSWIVPQFKFHTEAHKVWPASLYTQ